MSRVTVGLGSNLGDRFANLQAALRGAGAWVRWRAVSRVYETAPVGFADQGPFLNAVAEGETALAPGDLLAALKCLETDLGRAPGPRNGPRIIDLDVLLYDDLVQPGPPTLPHPRMHERAFVLRPLLDVAPGAVVPGRGQAATLLAGVTERGTTIWPDTLDLP